MGAKTLTQTSGTVTSEDGTTIAYSRSGDGPPLLMVDGALCHRAFGPATPLAQLLAAHFTVYTYDRRGRGESGDTKPYHPRREVEDVAAVIEAAGGSAYVYGISSGAVLSVAAAHAGAPIEKLALFEAPLVTDHSHTPPDPDLLAKVAADIAADRRGDAVKRFMKQVGMPSIVLAIMRLTPPWRQLKAVAHTLPYDLTIVDQYPSGEPIPTDRWNGATMPTLVISGTKSDAWMQATQQAIADVLPNARHHSLPGQNHMASAKALAPTLIDFFTH